MAKQDEAVLVEDDDELDTGTQNNGAQEEDYVAVEDEPKEKQVSGEDDEDEDEDEEDSQFKDSDSEEDREAIRERRRQEKRERKERREKAIGRDKTELNFLRNRNDELERRLMAIEGFTQKTIVNDIDRQLNEAVREAELADQVIAKAVEAGNGEDVTKALRYRDQAITRAQQLYQQKQISEAQANAPRQQSGMDKEVEHFAKEFIKTNSWYDPKGEDEDSAIVLAIDARLAQEGYDPRTEDYWDELQDRVKRRLPDKFEAFKKPARKPTGGPAVGSGREHAPQSSRKEIYISPERKAAMQELGVWDDPVLRQRYVKRYAEYDREAKNRDR